MEKRQPVAYYEVATTKLDQDARDESVEPYFERKAWVFWEDYKSGDHNYSLLAEPAELQCQNLLFTDAVCQLYTGLSHAAFSSVSEHLMPLYKETFQLHPPKQLLMTLMKFWHDLPQSELAETFHVTQEEVSDILCYWIDLMVENMNIYIPWLPKEVIRGTLPECFQQHCPDTTCIIHCFVLPLQKRKNKDLWTVSFCHYLSQDSIKFLVAMAPCGLIMFISPVYGGSSSDKFITATCGILEYLGPGNEVLVDQCFIISDLLAQREVRPISATNEDTVTLRIHVEEILFRFRSFKIISEKVSINLAPKLDKILSICAALCNLQSYSHKG